MSACAQQLAHLRPALLALQLDEGCELAAAGVDGEPLKRRQLGTGDQHHVGAVRGERASGDGGRDHPRQVEHAHARQRTVALRPRLWRGLADLLDGQHRKRGERLRLRRRRPFLMRAHQRHHRAAGIGRGLEGLAVPLIERGLDFLALLLAAEHVADRGAMMLEIGVQPHEAFVARGVDAGGRIPGRRRRLAVDAQIALGAAFGRRMHHVDRDVLRLPAALFPDFGGGKPAGRDRGLRRGIDAKRRRQHRLGAGQRDGIERGGIAAGEGPEIGEDVARGLHGQFRHCEER